MKSRAAKKSETLEVRISYETKQALKLKATSERRTVSDVIRGLISDYIVGRAREERHQHRRSLIGSGIVTRLNLGRALAASIVTGAALFALLMPASYAQDVAIALDGTFVPSNNKIHSFGTEIKVAYGESQEFVIDGSSHYSIILETTRPEGGDGDILISFKISRLGSGNPVTLAEPVVLVDFNENARIEFTDPNGGFYGFTARAKTMSSN